MSSSPQIGLPPSRFVVVACEASGDLLGAGLIEEIRRRVPDAVIEGIGGERMQAAGMTLWHHYDVLNVMGVAEVVRHLPRLLRLRREVLARTTRLDPDVFVGIDGPDFNLGLERKLRDRGIPTVHYVSPSIWAWREGRAKTIQRSADRVLCLFPMEPAIYARHGTPATFVGHPLASAFEQTPDSLLAREALDLDPGCRWVALLPGSRVSEVERLGRVFLQAALLVHRAWPDVHFLAPTANERSRAALLQMLDVLHIAEKGDEVVADENEWGGLRAQIAVVEGRSHEVMRAADALVLASGTAALEGMLAKRPMVVAYKVAPLTHLLVKTLGLLKIDRYSLPNVLAGEAVVPELMQEECTPGRIAETLLALLDQGHTAAAQVTRFHALHDSIRGPGSGGAAEAVLQVARSA